MTVYTILLFCHSYLRWAIVIGLVWLLMRSQRGMRTGRTWTERDERLHVLLVAFVDLQVLLGLALYFGVSPITQAFLANVGPSMKDSTLRFFGVEHAFSSLLALIALHVGRARSRRAPDARMRHRRVFVSLAIVFVLVLVAMPWPFLSYGRPLFRLVTAGG